MTMIYLGGAIDLVSKEERTTWREEMKQYTEQGVSFFDPAAAFSVDLHDRDATARLVEINRSALELCSAAIIVMSPDKASIGTPIEFFMVASGQIDVPYVVVWDPKDRPTCPSYDGMARGPLPAYITGIGVGDVVYSFADALDWLHKEFGLGINFIYPTPKVPFGNPVLTPSAPSDHEEISNQVKLTKPSGECKIVPCTDELISKLAKGLAECEDPEHGPEEDTESL